MITEILKNKYTRWKAQLKLTKMDIEYLERRNEII
jgi:hypothetical protein